MKQMRSFLKLDWYKSRSSSFHSQISTKVYRKEPYRLFNYKMLESNFADYTRKCRASETIYSIFSGAGASPRRARTVRHGIQRDRHGEKFIQPLNNRD